MTYQSNQSASLEYPLTPDNQFSAGAMRLFFMFSVLGMLLNMVWVFGRITETNGFTEFPTMLMLMLTMVPSITAKLPVKWLQRPSGFLLYYRRSLGIHTALWAIVHSLMEFHAFMGLDARNLLKPDMLLGITALVVFIILLATSNNASMRRLRERWKKLQSLVWVLVPVIIAHGLLSMETYDADHERQMTWYVLLPLLIIVASPLVSLLYKDNSKRNKGRLWSMGVGVVLSLVMVFAKGF